MGIFCGIGQAYKKLKEYNKALQFLNHALEKAPDNVDFLVERSSIYIELKKNQGSEAELGNAIKDLSKALSLKVDDP